MELPQTVFNWCVELGVLTEGHGTKGTQLHNSNVVLDTEASAAGITGHLLFFAAHNIALRYNLEVDAQLLGTAGAPLAPESTAANWNTVFDVYAAMGLALREAASPKVVQSAMEGNPMGASNMMKLAWEHFAATTAAPQKPSNGVTSPSRSPKPDRQRGGDPDNDIARARAKFRLRQEEQEALQRQQEKKYNDELRLRQIMMRSFDVEKFRTKTSQSRPPQSTSLLRQFQNRAVVLFCFKVVTNILETVMTGAAQAELLRQEAAKERARFVAQRRKEEGSRLLDNASPLHLAPGTDRALALQMSSIVMEIVQASTKDGIIDELIVRDTERQKQRELVKNIYARTRQENDTEKERLPLWLKMERKKAQSLEEEREARLQAEKKFQQMRSFNLERAVATKKESEAAELAKKQLAEAEKQREQQKAKEREEYFRQTRLVISLRRTEEAATQGHASIAAAEEAVRARILDRFGKEEAELHNSPVAPPPVVPLSSVSYASGANACYLGDDYGMQFLTDTEYRIMETLKAVRADASVLIDPLKKRRSVLGGNKVVWFSGTQDEKEPMIVREGASAVDACAQALQRQRPCKPTLGKLSIGLTLAARQHALDMAYHGIAHNAAHTGSDGSALASRVARYGTFAREAGSNELMFGVVRPHYVPISPIDIVLSWAIDDGESSREARRILFISGVSASSCGIGHAEALLDDRVVDVVCVIFSCDFNDRSISQMSAAHTNAIKALAPRFAEGLREVTSAVNLRLLYSAPNATIGRVSALPNLRMLMRDTKKKAGAVSVTPRSEIVSPPKPRTVHERVRHVSEPLDYSLAFEADSEPQRRSLQNSTKSTSNRSAGHRLSPLPHHPQVKAREEPLNTQPRKAKLPQIEGRSGSPRPQNEVRAPPPNPSQEAKHRVAVQRCVRHAAARLLQLLRRSKTRQSLALQQASAAEQERSISATTIQAFWRRAAAITVASQMRDFMYDLRVSTVTEAMHQEEETAAQIIATFLRGAHLKREGAVLLNDLRLQKLRCELIGPVIDFAISKALENITFVQWQQRIQALYRRHQPDKAGALGALLRRYEGREDLLLQALVEKYGAEDENVERLTKFFQRHAPEKLSRVQQILVKYAGHEDELFAELVAKYGPEPPRYSRSVLRFCLIIITRWKEYTPRRKAKEAIWGDDKRAINVEEVYACRMIQRWATRYMLRLRTRREVESARSLPLRDRLIRFYTKYDPSKVESVDSMLEKYRDTDPSELFEALVDRYGPE